MALYLSESTCTHNQIIKVDTLYLSDAINYYVVYTIQCVVYTQHLSDVIIGNGIMLLYNPVCCVYRFSMI